MKIGIFGGCFNPPHKMHYDIANNLIEKGYLDKVIFVPTGDNYAKKDLAMHEDRVNMLNIMVDRVDMLVSDICRNGKYVYTYEVLDYYKKTYPKATIYFICGTDNLEWFKEWKNYEYILTNYKLLVIARNNNNITEIMKKYEGYEGNIKIANINPRALSSTIVREYIASGEISKLKYAVSENVVSYITKKGLYKKQD